MSFLHMAVSERRAHPDCKVSAFQAEKIWNIEQLSDPLIEDRGGHTPRPIHQHDNTTKKREILQLAVPGVERLSAEQDLLVIKLKSFLVTDTSCILLVLNISRFLLSFSPRAPLNWGVQKTLFFHDEGSSNSS